MATITEIPDDFNSVCALCNTLSLHRCSACRLVSYCSKEHQKQHWSQHKLQCRPFEINSNAELGRYLTANRDIKKEETILIESPLVFGPKIIEAEAICLGCNRPISEQTNRCLRCFWPVCNPLCPGLTDPQKHATECILLSIKKGQHSEAKTFRYEIITPLRCLLLQRRNPHKWKQIMSMEAHMQERGPKSDIYKEIDENVIKPLVREYLSEIDTDVLGNVSPEIIQHLCGVLDVNALEVRIGNSTLIALYPTAYLMAHSCLPNTKHTFYNMRIALVAAEDISKQSQITTMYTNALWGTQARRDHLKTTKYFSCQCKRCADPTELNTYFSALKCLAETKDGTCTGYQLPVSPLDDKSVWACNKCPVSLTANEANHLIFSLGNEIDFLMQSNNFKPSVKELEDMLRKLQTLLHPHHYHCYTVCHSLIQVYGHQSGFQHKELSDELLQRKSSICRQLLTTTLTLDPGKSRLSLYTAVLQYELHSALMELSSRKANSSETLGYVQEAKKLLLQEIDMLKNEPDFSPGEQMKDLAQKSLKKFCTDTAFGLSTAEFTRELVKNDYQVYVYSFEYHGQFGIEYNTHLKDLNVTGVGHGDELDYLFWLSYMNQTAVSEDEPAKKTLRRMVKLWTNFVKSGNPTPDVIPGSDNVLGTFKLAPNTNGTYHYAVISEKLTMSTDNFKEESLLVWKDVDAAASAIRMYCSLSLPTIAALFLHLV